MWGYPWVSLAGAGAIVAILATTPFTAAFALTLVYGVPVLAMLAGVYAAFLRPPSSSRRTPGSMDTRG
jgi:hypothetical protein